jgi:hypothetical protein
MSDYDCTADVLEHKRKVTRYLNDFVIDLAYRAMNHDNSKLESPEKEGFDQWTPELKARTFGTEYYKQALEGMGEFLQHHYRANSHHPEHYENGVDGMDLQDLVEMFCDWRAAAEGKGVALDLDYAAKRFNLSPQLVSVFRNTLRILK